MQGNYRTCPCGKKVHIRQGDTCPYCLKTEKQHEAKTRTEEKAQTTSPKKQSENNTLKKCKFCAMDIPRAATICPYCRKKVPATAAVLFLIATFIFAFFIMIGTFGSQASKRPKSQEDIESDAIYMSRQFVKKQLKSPSSAEFSPKYETNVIDLGEDNKYRVVGWVDAKNSFGVMIRNRYGCTLQLKGDTWHGSDVDILSN